MAKINVIQNDNNITLVFNIKKDGRVESILGAVVSFNMKEVNTGLEYKRECTITDPTSAEAIYVLKQEDTHIVGTFQTEVEVLYPNGTRLTKLNPLIINVLPEMVK